MHRYFKTLAKLSLRHEAQSGSWQGTTTVCRALATSIKGVSEQKLQTIAPDQIQLRGMTFFGYHGVLPEETSLGQRFVVDTTLYCRLGPAGKSDNLEDTVNYAEVYRLIQRILEGRPQKLLETVAEMIATEVLDKNILVEAVRVGVRKPHVAVPGMLDSLGIEIKRVRSSF